MDEESDIIVIIKIRRSIQPKNLLFSMYNNMCVHILCLDVVYKSWLWIRCSFQYKRE